MEIVEFRPEREQYAFTFGGVAPVRKVVPGTMLRLWTEDAFCGGIRSTAETSATERQSRQKPRMDWHSGLSTDRSRAS